MRRAGDFARQTRPRALVQSAPPELLPAGHSPGSRVALAAGARKPSDRPPRRASANSPPLALAHSRGISGTNTSQPPRPNWHQPLALGVDWRVAVDILQHHSPPSIVVGVPAQLVSTADPAVGPFAFEFFVVLVAREATVGVRL